MKCIFPSLLIILCIVACKQKQNVSNTGSPIAESVAQEALYPFPQYIENQLAYMDSFPSAPEMITYENGLKKDSVSITLNQLKTIARAFSEPDLNEKKFRSEYLESSFQDLSLNTITFTIDTKNPELQVQKADILLDPDTKEVKYLVIRKQEKQNGLSVLSNLMWVNNSYFQISTSASDSLGKESNRMVKVIWNKPLKNQ